MDRMRLIQELCGVIGVSGYEEYVRETIRDKVSPLVDEIRTDALGNLVAVINPGADLTLMIEAHMDEIGFLVSHVESEGLLRFSTLGGWDPRVLPAHPVVIQTAAGGRVMGAIGMAPPHVLSPEEQKKSVSPEDLFIDVGASNAAAAQELNIGVGSPGTLFSPFTELGGGAVMAKALDDRLGCAVLIELLEWFSDNRPDFTLAAVFSSAEEIGGRGATVAAYSVHPDVALVLEATVGDTPGLPDRKQPTRMGKGAAITVADKRIIVPRYLIQYIAQLAEREKIAFQYKTPIFGGTDAGAIHMSREGVLTAVLSVPCRYIHSPISLFRMEDYESVLNLSAAFAKRMREIVALREAQI